MKIINQKKLLAQAETICLSRGVRLTPQRLEILRLITEQPGAISAYDLLDLLREVEPQAKPPTVYRGLEFLLEQGFIHKIESTNSYVLCHHFEEPSHTSAMFICESCGSVTEKDAKDIESTIQQLAQGTGFHLYNSVIEVHGLCFSCHEINSCTEHDTCQHNHTAEKNKKK
ncbi:zinc uptake transcriptional repressor Zur [Xenorhabdus nematophila]|uniref:zinc uptake transcriptional repressor Zur n=1 Tax=Xenorhabdus nematophila TaxID=628 RepID=UPI000542EEA6|nr:zinc uptake transcriptional repressor Zur [Xenorhabdus nematophila]CEE90681.1 transcriptional repressor of Zn transport system (Fur family) [Xenorhabdus nematophila str. Anatoliense]CEF32630.1 transcriptional repressor of Zn transport system (Fur family) [Xenorhabdus nematophila str. Websteri]AYA42212.1 transcriptional regulator Zur [Xenorhabdus nematophila]KHD28946.1 zinc uptake transcriptional repressor [Xenorhabdus nematophila]MBA0020938.1 zinc uptake transcriptional repressor Zur [Xenor